MAAMEARLRRSEQSESLEMDMTTHAAAGKQAEQERTRKISLRNGPNAGRTSMTRQVLGTCEKCGYMSSQAMCQACMLLEGLNKNRAQIQI